VDQIKIPGVRPGIVSVQDVTAPSQPGAPPPLQVTPTAGAAAAPGHARAALALAVQGSQGQQQAQKTTGKAHRKVRPR